MAESDTHLVNQALGMLGQKPIVDILDGGDPVARCARLHIEDTRDQVLRRHPWSFAKKPTNLSKLAAVPLSHFGAQYALPADFISLVELEKIDLWGIDSDRYEIQGGDDNLPNVILCHDAGPFLTIRYVRRVMDTTKYDSLFTQCFVTLLASKMAATVTGSMQNAQALVSAYEQINLPNARRANAAENRGNVIHPVMQQIRNSAGHQARRRGW